MTNRRKLEVDKATQEIRATRVALESFVKAINSSNVNNSITKHNLVLSLIGDSAIRLLCK